MVLAQHQSLSNEHYTPPVIVEAARETMGTIDLDPASSQVANDHIVKANKYYSIEDDGLSQPWSGNIFLNPPGGKIKNKSQQAIWWDYLWNERLEGEVRDAIFVAFNLEIIRMRPSVLDYPHCIPSERPRYWSIDPETGKPREGQWSNTAQKWTNSPSHATIIIYLPDLVDHKNHRSKEERFISTFSQIGRVRV